MYILYISSKLKNNNPNKSAILNTFLLLTGKHTLNKLDRFLKNILYIRLCNTHIFQSTVCIAYITFNLVITDVDSSEFADNIHERILIILRKCHTIMICCLINSLWNLIIRNLIGIKKPFYINNNIRNSIIINNKISVK